VTLVVRGMPPLERVADPTDATYVPRPEWYFLALFQLLKYFPGRLELVASLVIPGLTGLALALLPWIDRGPARDPRKRPVVLAGVLIGVLSLGTLTTLGWRDRPPGSAGTASAWSLREVAGEAWLAAANCTRCHAEGGVAEGLAAVRITRPPDWLMGHVADPEVIAPGVRDAPGANEREVAAIVAFVRRLSRGEQLPAVSPGVQTVARVFARHCVGCHTIDGDGGKDGPDLSHIGREHDRDWFRRWIAQPTDIKPDAEMPAFGRRLQAPELDAIATYLAGRR
jgi:mono/diheme cytochrome c family protein